MESLRVFFSRTVSHLRRKKWEWDMDEELRFHLESEAEAQMRNGLSRREAFRLAHQRLGGLERIRIEQREQRSLGMIDSTVQDLRFALRSLRLHPGFSAAIILVAALGIGSNTAIFSLVNTALLAPLPYPEPDRLVMIHQIWESGFGSAHSGQSVAFLDSNLGEWAQIATTGYGSGVNLAMGTSATYVRHQPVSAEYFDVLGVAPELGRPFNQEEDRDGGPEAVVLSGHLWRELFDSNRNVVGTAVRIGGVPHTIVGVMPDSFESLPPVDLWTPLRARSNIQGSGTNYSVIGRMADGVTEEQAKERLAALSVGYRESLPERTRFHSYGIEPYQTRLSAGVKPALLMLSGAVGLVLLIACANISSLLLARWATRRTEVATRVALGSSRGRLIQQFLTEGIVLASLGGIIGLVSYRWTLGLLLATAPTDLVLWRDVETDYRVITFLVVVSLLTGLFFTLVPAFHASRLDPAQHLTAGRTAARKSTHWARGALVITEVALCVVLLIGSGLLVRTFINLRSVDPGFDPGNVLTAQMSMEGNHFSDVIQLGGFFEDGLARMEQLPGIEAAAISNNLPIERGLNVPVKLNAPDVTDIVAIDWRYTSADYFDVLRIPLRQGRLYDNTDHPESLKVTVVNEAFVRRFYPGRVPLGEEITIPPFAGKEPVTYRIIGIVGDVKGRGLASPPVETMYVPYQQVSMDLFNVSHTYFQMNWVFRLDADQAPIADLRELLREMDPLQPFSGFRTMEEILTGSVRTEAFQMWLLAAFGGAALLLTIIGIYGLISFLVTQRTREIGIRMALGASLQQVLFSMTRRGVLLATLGVAAGTIAALALTQALQSFLFGVDALDPVTFVVVIALMLCVAAAASFLPSLRLVRLSPATTLRQL